jgi:peptidyl-prolyl cis-trans isomerase A (cyclophilin A)
LFFEETTDPKKEIHAVKLSHHRSGLLATAALAFAFFASTAAAQAPASSQAPAKKPATAGASKTAKTGPDPALLHPATLKAQAPETFQVKFETTAGDFTVNVTRAWAPLGADRFYNLAKHHFFDGASFFRVVPGFVIQFGISQYPSVSSAWDKAIIKDDPVKESNRPGTLTFATSGLNSRTTQWFFNLVDNKRLDASGFSPFGQVTDGLDVVQKIYSGYGDMPAMGGKGPSPELIETQGKAYLDKDFPKLDTIKTTTIIGEPAPVHHPAAAKKPAAAPAPKPQS